MEGRGQPWLTRVALYRKREWRAESGEKIKNKRRRIGDKKLIFKEN